MIDNQYQAPKKDGDHSVWEEKLREYHYNAYKNLIKISLFLNAAGITAVMATFGLKHNSSREMAASRAHELSFMQPFLPIDAVLNSALNYFLVSIAFVVLCVIVEYLSYFSRRNHTEYISSKDIPCCFCKTYINLSEIVMFLCLTGTFIFLIIGGLKFLNL